MNTRHSLSDSRPGPACAAFESLLPLVSHRLLGPEEEHRLQAHLADCPHCRARLAAYDRLDGALRQRYGQVAMPPLHCEDIVKKLENQEKAGSFELPAVAAPTPPLRPHPRTRRAISWVGAIAAVLLIALITTALVVSRHSSTPGKQAAPISGVYFSAVTADSPQQAFLYALNPADGAMRWHVPLPTGPSLTMTPALVAHGILYVLAQVVGSADSTKDATHTQNGSGSTASAVSAFQTSDGKQVWRTPLGGVPTSFIASDGALYIGTDNGGLYALNASDGAVRWHSAPGNMVDVMQAVDGLVYVGVYRNVSANTVTGELTAFNTSDGSVKWSFPLQGQAETIQVSSGQVAVVDTRAATDQNNVFALLQWFSLLSASDGSVKWRYHGDPSTLGAAFLEQDTVYVTLVGGSGKERPAVKLQALNASDGSVRWQKSYAGFSLLRPDQGLAGGDVYLMTTNDATLYALHAQDGSEAWHAHLGQRGYLQRLAGGTLYAETSTTLSAFNSADGSALWRYPLGDGGLITSADSQAVYGITKSTTPQQHWSLRLFAIAASTGKLLWHYDSMFSMIAPLIG